MFKFLIFLILLVGSSLFVTEVFSLEIELQRESEREREAMGWLMPTQHSLQEQFQLIIDRTTLKNKISLGWLSTDQNHISLPKTLENISSNPKIVSFTITNEFACASTKLDKACIIIEIEREGLGDNTPEILKNTREIVDKIFLTGEGDTILYFEPEFYSATLEQKLTFDELKESLVSRAVYTIQKQETDRMFPVLSTLLSNDIITSGGFYSNAEKLSENTFSDFTLTLVPLEDEMLRTLHISVTCSNELRTWPVCDKGDISEQMARGYISPLDFLQVQNEGKLEFEIKNINRSKIFADEFSPLNSIIQVLIYSDENLQVKSVNSKIIENLETLGDIQESGWFFVSNRGKVIDARYIFGQEFSVSKNSLGLSIGPSNDSPVTEIKAPNEGNELLGQDGGGCLIATAAFGSELAPQVQLLREIRDNTVLQTESGSTFMTGFNQFYYSFSPVVADYERENSVFKEVVKLTLTPLLTSLTLLQYADIDSESEMFGYGISIILLNIGMYFVAPAILIMSIKKRI
jgi:hypothetical protein